MSVSGLLAILIFTVVIGGLFVIDLLAKIVRRLETISHSQGKFWTVYSRKNPPQDADFF